MDEMIKEMSENEGWTDLNKWPIEIVVEALRQQLVKVAASDIPGRNLKLI